jgi:tRNA G10  N-methylase Trm11
MNYVTILGRQPEFGIAELESLLGSKSIKGINGSQAIIEFKYDIPYGRFGSVLKFAKLSQTLIDRNNQNTADIIADYIIDNHPYEDGVKLKLGFSDYSGSFSAQAIQKLALEVKKILKSSGYSVRIVPNKNSALNSAQILHNGLNKENGSEILFTKFDGQVFLAKTVYEQDIESYAARDQVRPMRDARVGMLPPKLAQTIINLATGSLDKDDIKNKTLLDPFCGTGVVLQEALLMGYDAYGTDLEPRMIDYSQKNLDWIKNEYPSLLFGDVNLSIGDATNFKWNDYDYVACETYLGRPLSNLPDPSTLTELVQSVNTLHKKMFTNIASQAKAGTRMCFAVPAWQTKKGFVHLPVLDQIAKLGYNQLVFSHVDAKNLIYARENQIVARQLVVLQKQ